MPGDGAAGERRIVATVIQNGLPRAQMTVARYGAPGPLPVGRAGALQLRASGKTLAIHWGARHPGVAHWLVTARLTSGMIRWMTLPATATGASFPDIVPVRWASVTIVGQSRDGRRARAVTASLPAPKPPA